MREQEIKDLLERFTKGECTPEESAFVAEWFNDAASKKSVSVTQQELSTRKANTLRAILSPMLITAPIRRKLYSNYVKYAAAVAAVVFGIWFFSSKYLGGDSNAGSSYASDIAPGRNGATLTLASGEVIALSGEKKGVIVGADLRYSDGSVIGGSNSKGNQMPVGDNPLSPQGGSLPEGERGRGGHLSPSGRDAAGREGSKMLTASTAKGQTYQFTLPDGTHIFLNADSKLEFPLQFSGKERKVLLKGEAYFEVAHNAKQPFKVESKGQVVEDIGTEFNINAYPDEVNVKTTLVEGSAIVSQLTTHNSELLNPNQQAIVENGRIDIKTVQVQQYIAWKNGKFEFAAEDLYSVMRKLSRWYNVEVQYDGDFKDISISGSIGRRDQISKILDKITYVHKINFKVEGRRVTVMR